MVGVQTVCAFVFEYRAKTRTTVAKIDLRLLDRNLMKAVEHGDVDEGIRFCSAGYVDFEPLERPGPSQTRRVMSRIT